LLANAFGFDTGADGEEAFQFEFADEVGIAVAQFLVQLHHTPFVENQRLHAGHGGVGGVVAVPSIFAKGLINLDDFTAMLAEFAPKRDVGQDGHVEVELAGGLLVIHFHQGAAKGLVGDLGFAADERVRRNFLNVAGDFAGNAEAAIVLVDAFVQRIGHTEAIAGFKRGGGYCKESGFDEIVGAKKRKIFGFGREFQTAIAIAEEADVGGIANPLAFDGLKFFYDALGAIGRAVIEDDDAIRPECLFGKGFKSLLDKFLAVINGNDRDDVGSHCRID